MNSVLKHPLLGGSIALQDDMYSMVINVAYSLVKPSGGPEDQIFEVEIPHC